MDDGRIEHVLRENVVSGRTGKLGRIAAGALVALAPVTLGGCPEFRNQLVDIAETATRTVVFSEVGSQETIENVIFGVVDAGIGILFEQFRADTNTFN